MKIELLEVPVTELRLGDEWHDDEQVFDGEGVRSRFIHSMTGCLWRVINHPIRSTNTQLFWDQFGSDCSCIVVPVEYVDRARGSRLFGVNEKLIIRRDVEQKGV